MLRLTLCIKTASQVKSNQVNDVTRQTQAAMSHVRVILEKLLQLFNVFQCHIQIDLRYR